MRNRFVPVLLVAAFASGCSNPAAHQDAITKFHDATTAVIANAKATYASVNQAERQHFVAQQILQRKAIDPTALENVDVLSAGEIAMRTNALDVLAKYADLLAQLAVVPTTSSAKTKTAGMQQALTDLTSGFDQLTGSNSANFQGRVKSVVPLLGSALQAFENAKTVAALKKAVADAGKPVNELIAALETDMQLARARQRTFLSGQRADAFKKYNADLAANSPAPALRADADAILQMEDQWDAFASNSPVAGLEAMKKAYAALADFAGKPKPSPADFAGLLAEVDSFSNAAKQVGLAAKTFIGK